PYLGINWSKAMFAIDPVTPSEAQFLTGRTEKDINRAIDRGVVEKILEVVRVPANRQTHAKRIKRKHGKRRKGTQRVLGYAPPPTVKKTVRKLGAPELLFLALERDVHADLTPAGRRKLYEAIKTQPANLTILNFGPFEADVAKTAKALVARYKD